VTRVDVVLFDVNETLADLAPVDRRLEELGAPPGSAPRWLTCVLRDGIGLTAAGTSVPFADLVAVHPWDVDGACRAGLVGAWVDRGGRPYPAVMAPPVVTGSSLVEVVAGLVQEAASGAAAPSVAHGVIAVPGPTTSVHARARRRRVDRCRRLSTTSVHTDARKRRVDRCRRSPSQSRTAS
jgi:hypothetical protein